MPLTKTKSKLSCFDSPSNLKHICSWNLGMVSCAHILQMNWVGALHFAQTNNSSNIPPHFLHDSSGN